jgi:hypothetical protein
MPQSNLTTNRTTWQIGQRVSRKSTDELGTVVEINGSIKVRWDGGATSYFRHGAPGNIQLRWRASSAQRDAKFTRTR